VFVDTGNFTATQGQIFALAGGVTADSVVIDGTTDPLIRLVESGNSGFKLYYDGDGTNDFIIGAGTGGTFTSYLTMARANGALTLSAPQTINSGLNTIVLTLSDVTTDATNKLARFGSKHYTNSEEPVAISYSNNTTSASVLNHGGGTGLMNAVTSQAFYTAVNNTTVTGTARMILDETNGGGRLTLGATAGTGVGNLFLDSLYFGTTLAIDASRNATLGTISSGAITASGNSTLGGANSVQVMRDTMRVGNASNNVTIDSTRSLIMKGNSTVWDDLNFPLVQGKQGALSKPDFDYDSLTYMFPQNDTTEVLSVQIQIPHSWKEGSTVYPHLHIQQSKNLQATFKIVYKWWDVGEAIPSAWLDYTMGTYSYSYTSGILQQILKGSGGISGSGKVASSMFLAKIYRTDNVYTGDIGAITFDLHAEFDKLGGEANDL